MATNTSDGFYEIKHPYEAAITTDLRPAPHNFTLWDTETETQLVMFKGEKSPVLPNCLQMIDDKYVITAHDNVLRIWSIVGKFRQEQKLILPSRPSALAVSPCGNYLIVGKEETLNIWQLSNGNLLTSVQKHYQTISVIKICADSSFILTGGEDGIVFVWSLADLLCGTRNVSRLNHDRQLTTSSDEPRYTWQHHSSQVTAIHLTYEGKNGLSLTASTDQTINIYSLVDGRRLANVVMPTPIWSVIMDRRETRAYLGGQDGNIYEMATNSLGFSLANSQKSDEQRKPVFVGHKGKITCLQLSIDGRRLISASLDSTCKIWSTETRRLIRDLKHQGPVVNLKLLLIPGSLAISTQSKNEDPLPIKPLRRALHKPIGDVLVGVEDLYDDEHVVNIRNPNDIENTYSANNYDLQLSKSTTTESTHTDDELHDGGAIVPVLDNSVEVPRPKDLSKIANLKRALKDLYLLAAEKIFKDASHEALKPYAITDGSETEQVATKRKRLSLN